MLIQLTAEQVAERWEILKPAIRASLPPISGREDSRMVNILKSAIRGTLQVWAIVPNDMKEGEDDWLGLLTTVMSIDGISKTRSLLIYSLYSYGELGVADFKEGMKALIKFGKHLGCATVSAYTEVESIKKAIKRIGGSSNMSYLTLKIGE